MIHCVWQSLAAATAATTHVLRRSTLMMGKMMTMMIIIMGVVQGHMTRARHVLVADTVRSRGLSMVEGGLARVILHGCVPRRVLVLRSRLARTWCCRVHWDSFVSTSRMMGPTTRPHPRQPGVVVPGILGMRSGIMLVRSRILRVSPGGGMGKNIRVTLGPGRLGACVDPSRRVAVTRAGHASWQAVWLVDVAHWVPVRSRQVPGWRNTRVAIMRNRGHVVMHSDIRCGN